MCSLMCSLLCSHLPSDRSRKMDRRQMSLLHFLRTECVDLPHDISLHRIQSVIVRGRHELLNIRRTYVLSSSNHMMSSFSICCRHDGASRGELPFFLMPKRCCQPFRAALLSFFVDTSLPAVRSFHSRPPDLRTPFSSRQMSCFFLLPSRMPSKHTRAKNKERTVPAWNNCAARFTCQISG